MPKPTLPSVTWGIAKVLGVGFSGYCLSGIIFHHLVTYTETAGPSMYPTLPSANTLSIIDRRHRANRLNRLKVGDIITAKHPLFMHGDVGKRIIGMPGDYVVRDASIAQTVGGSIMPGFFDGNADGTPRQEPQMIRVPEGHVWATGDNMAWSRDCRFYGPIPMALVQGKVVANVQHPILWTWLKRDFLVPAADDDKWREMKVQKAKEQTK